VIPLFAATGDFGNRSILTILAKVLSMTGGEKRFRGGLVFQAHRLLYHSRLESNKEEEEEGIPTGIFPGIPAAANRGG